MQSTVSLLIPVPRPLSLPPLKMAVSILLIRDNRSGEVRVYSLHPNEILSNLCVSYSNDTLENFRL